MDEQERELEQLLQRAERLMQQYSIADSPDPRLEEVLELRQGIHHELQRYRVHHFVDTLRKAQSPA